MSTATAELTTQITYLLPTSTINRRFWAPGEEYNTGTYAPYDVVIRNARLSAPFTLDLHGFALGQHKTDITDWIANYAHDSDYALQVCDVAMAMSGADLVIPMSGQIRTSGLTSATMQPPAADAHADSTIKTANKLAETIFRHSPDHRWWYFPDMTADEVIFIKFHDSDHNRAWHAPHTAFRDASRPDAVERRSIEFRGVAYFTRD